MIKELSLMVKYGRFSIWMIVFFFPFPEEVFFTFACRGYALGNQSCIRIGLLKLLYNLHLPVSGRV